MTEGETQDSENDLEEVAVKLGFGKNKKALDKRIWNSRIWDKAGDHGLRWNTIAPSMEISLILLEGRSDTCGRLKYRNFLRRLFQCNQQVAVWFVSAEAGESPYLHSIWAVKRNTGGSWQACKLEGSNFISCPINLHWLAEKEFQLESQMFSYRSRGWGDVCNQEVSIKQVEDWKLWRYVIKRNIWNQLAQINLQLFPRSKMECSFREFSPHKKTVQTAKTVLF